MYRAEEPLNDVVALRTMSDGGFGVAEAEAAKVLVPDCLYNRNVINSFEHVRHSLRKNLLSSAASHFVLPIMEQATGIPVSTTHTPLRDEIKGLAASKPSMLLERKSMVF